MILKHISCVFIKKQAILIHKTLSTTIPYINKRVHLKWTLTEFSDSLCEPKVKDPPENWEEDVRLWRVDSIHKLQFLILG